MKKLINGLLLLTIILLLASCKKMYTITILDISNGKVEVSKTTALENEEITVIVTPNSGYSLEEIYYEFNGSKTNIIDNRFNMPKGNVLVNATFKLNEVFYSVDVISSNGGSISTSKNSYKSGEEVSITTTALEGYSFYKAFYIVNELHVEIKNNKFIMPSNNIKLKADFILQEDNMYNNPYGYANINITDKSSIEGVLINDEIEFLQAVKNKNNVIIIDDYATLDLGYLSIKKKLSEKQMSENLFEDIITDFKTNAKGYKDNLRMHPDLIESGVSKLTLKNINNMLIYSQKGATIKHVGVIIDSCTDIVFRNLKMTDIWEWDEQTKGKYDGADWQYFGIRYSSSLWFDHMTFGIAYDGIIDIEDKSKDITISYIEVEGHITDFVRRQFEYLDSIIESSDYDGSLPYYEKVKEAYGPTNPYGVTFDDMLLVYSSQKKGFNIGTAEDLTNKEFDKMTVTIHNSYFKNFQDRLPRLRAGDVHMYNIISDQSDIYKIVQKVGSSNTTSSTNEASPYYIVRQAIVTTQGGNVFGENILFINVNSPVKTNQQSIQTPDKYWSGSFLVLNSEYVLNGVSNTIDSNMPGTAFKSSSSVNENKEFRLTNYCDLPYTYTTIPTSSLTEHLANTSGFQKLDINWSYINKEIGVNNDAVNIKINETRLEDDKEDIIYLNKGTNIVYQDLVVYNFYVLNTKLILEKDIDYILEITSDVDSMVSGVYSVTHTYTSLHNDKDIYVLTYQIKVVEEGTLIEGATLTNEYNKLVDVSFTITTNMIDIYIISSNIDNLTDEYIIENGLLFTNHTSSFITSFQSNHNKYLYILAKQDEVIQVIKLEVVNEEIKEIYTVDDFKEMLEDTNSLGKYYNLNNDLDFTDVVIKESSNFKGVLNGNNYTIKNITHTRSLFTIITNCVIQNLKIDNAFVSGKVQNSASILVGKVEGNCTLYNIVLSNSSVGKIDDRANQQYSSLIIANLDNPTAPSLDLQYISIINSYLYTSANNTGALLAMGYTGNNNDGTLNISNIYIYNVHIDSTGITSSLICGRLRTNNATISNIVVADSSVVANQRVGIVIGLIGNTCTNFSVSNMYLDAEISILGTDKSIGHVVGFNEINATSSCSNIYASDLFDIELSGVNSINAEIVTLSDISFWNNSLNNFDSNWVYDSELLVKVLVHDNL